MFITNNNWLMIFKQVVGVYFGNLPKRKNGPALCGQTAHIFLKLSRTVEHKMCSDRLQMC